MSDTSFAAEVLADVEQHLAFASKVINRKDFPKDLRADLKGSLSDIRQRRDDPQLYLVIVGESSTGKSTFVNALLGDDLLKTSNLPETTSTAVCLSHGERLALDLGYTDDDGTFHHLRGREGEPVMHDLAELSQMVEVRSLIETFSTDDAYARRLSHLYIQHPAPFLANQITLIDLPGANVQKAHHVELAREAIADADAAIVIIDGSQPLSNYLVEFLLEALGGSLHRCLYVVTRMDFHPDPAERQRVLRHVETQVKTRLGVEKPRIFGCSAQAVVDDFSGEAPQVKTERDHWRAEFAALQNHLLDILRYERSLVIAERLVHLLEKLFTPLEEPLRVQLADYEQRWQAVQANEIRNLKAFVGEQHDHVTRAVDAAYHSEAAKLMNEVDSLHSSLRSTLYNGIHYAGDWDALDRFVGSGIERETNSAGESLSSAVEKHMKKLRQEAKEAGEAVEQAFADVYQRIPGLKISHSSGKIAFSHNGDMNAVVMPVQSVNARLEEEAGGNALKAAAAGAVVGSILPGIGTIAGAVIGGIAGLVFGYRVSRGSLADRKQALWNELSGSLGSSLADSRAQVASSFRRYADSLKGSLTESIEAHRRQYEAVVAELNRQRDEEKAALDEQKISTQQAIQELKDRLVILADHQKQLRAERYAGDQS